MNNSIHKNNSLPMQRCKESCRRHKITIHNLHNIKQQKQYGAFEHSKLSMSRVLESRQ